MIYGHGDDLHLYPNIEANFSSNVYADTCNVDLFGHLAQVMPAILGSYPEPEPLTLQSELARYHGLVSDQVLVTNGATEAIYLVAQLTRGQNSHVVQPTFSEYVDAAKLFSHHFVPIESADVIWCCNPNNPTGQLCDELALSAQANLLIVDRSYQYFSRVELPLVTSERLEAERIVYIHSLTKRYRIPGLRLGYIIAPVWIIQQLRTLRQPWSVNAMAIEAGRWIVRHGMPDMIDRPSLWREVDRLSKHLSQMEGYTTEPTVTHFMLMRTPYLASELKQVLAEEFGLLVRDASNFPALSPFHIRIATQTPHANDRLIEALNQINKRSR